MQLQQQHAAVRVRAQAHFTVVLSEPAHLGSPLKIAAHRRVVTDQVEAQAATVNDVLDPAEQVRGMGRRWEPCTSGWSPTGPFTDTLASTGSSAGRAGPLSGSGRQNLMRSVEPLCEGRLQQWPAGQHSRNRVQTETY